MGKVNCCESGRKVITYLEGEDKYVITVPGSDETYIDWYVDYCPFCGYELEVPEEVYCVLNSIDSERVEDFSLKSVALPDWTPEQVAELRGKEIFIDHAICTVLGLNAKFDSDMVVDGKVILFVHIDRIVP